MSQNVIFIDQKCFRYLKLSKKEVITGKEVSDYPYVYRVGPSFMKEEDKDERFFEGFFDNSTFKFFQKIHKTDECTKYLNKKEKLKEGDFECVGGKWYAPKRCTLEPSTFSTINDVLLDDGYPYTVPVIKSYVYDNDDCGAILMKKIRKSDVDWITKVTQNYFIHSSSDLNLGSE